MNILIDQVPTAVEINNTQYEINSDFRTAILFEQLMLDNNITDEYKFFQSLKLFYPTIPEENLMEAFNKILWFYSCSKDTEFKSKSKSKKYIDEKIYDWDFDDEYIYAAFLEQFNINLQEISYLHWWEFKAMFKSLNDKVKFSEILKYRSINLNEITDKKEKEFYKKMKEIYALPIDKNKEEQQKLEAIEDILNNGYILNSEKL